MRLPSRGAILGDTSDMVNPHKIGQVMWARDRFENMVPLDLHERVAESDSKALNKIFYTLSEFRKVAPALEIVRSTLWCGFSIVKPYLIMSMEGRSEARYMISNGSWEEFWHSIDYRCVHSGKVVV